MVLLSVSDIVIILCDHIPIDVCVCVCVCVCDGLCSISFSVWKRNLSAGWTGMENRTGSLN